MQATVGAGLPVIATLKHLVDTGDRILKVEGIFSGTLSYIFNMFSQDKPFSDIVTEAKALGYTEPDPRDDLAGMDVARKVTILARYSSSLLIHTRYCGDAVEKHRAHCLARQSNAE